MTIPVQCKILNYLVLLTCRDRERRERVPGEEPEEGVKIKQEPEDGKGKTFLCMI